jgi:hypothetical protein
MYSNQLLDELISKLDGMSPEQLQGIASQFELSKPKFVPSPGPQTEAWLSEADILLYGGQAGGGKTALGVGLALCNHRRSLLMRRQGVELQNVIDEAIRFNGTRDGFNGSQPASLKTSDGKLLEFGACKILGDEQSWQGRPHDFLYLDEAVHFLEAQVRFLMGWVRLGSGVPRTQRTRVVLGSNPPVTSDGQWVIPFFRPWLDITHPNPAKHGELRWFVTNPDGKDQEVSGPEPYQFPGQKKPVRPMSRTFIPSPLGANPYLARTDYASKLDALPEPLRSAVRDGNFMASRVDANNQIIPTNWVVEAQKRWEEDGGSKGIMSAIGFDPAGSGPDKATIACRHAGWYAPIVCIDGERKEDGNAIAVEVIKVRRDEAPVVVDVGAGYAGAAIERFRDNGIHFTRWNFGAASAARSLNSNLPFLNKRAEAWWRFREALDPNQLGGSVIALPPDEELKNDLTAPTWDLSSGKIKVESKDDLRDRLGRSPDKADAVILALQEAKNDTYKRSFLRNTPQVINKRPK